MEPDQKPAAPDGSPADAQGADNNDDEGHATDAPMGCAFYLFIRQPMGRKSALRREIPWILRGIPRASKLLICGLFQKGRVLAQDGVRASVAWESATRRRRNGSSTSPARPSSPG